VQHLNLYTQLDRPVEPPYSFRQMIAIVAIIFIVMLVATVWVTVDKNSQSSLLKPLLQQEQLLSGELEQLRAEMTRSKNDKTLDNSIAELNNDVLFRRRLLEELDPAGADLGEGFSEHLQGLARQSVDGLWLTNILLQEGGLYLSLSGRATSPELVPRFLKNLAEEPIYQGHSFRIFKINSPDDGGKILDFEIKARGLDE
jgi:hypothetical protein